MAYEHLIEPPPMSGPGGTKQAWQAYAINLAKTALEWREVAYINFATIEKLEAENAELRARIASRRPKGGRPPIDDEKAARIRADVEAGLSRRAVAARHGVSAMTVTRLSRHRDK